MSASQQSAEGEGTPSGDPPAAPCASAESVEDAASAPEGASVSDERRRAKRGGGGRGARRGGAAASKSARAHESEEASELHRAVRAGDKAEVERILSDASRAFLVHAIDSLRRAPLHLAAYEGDEAMCRLLLQRGARVSAAAQDNMTPLHFAALRGHASIVALLIKKGASVDARVSRGLRTPLHMALKNGKIEAALSLIEHGADLEAKTAKGESAAEWVSADKLALLKEAAESVKKRPLKRMREERTPEKASSPTCPAENVASPAPCMEPPKNHATRDAEGDDAHAEKALPSSPPREKKAKVVIAAAQDEELAL